MMKIVSLCLIVFVLGASSQDDSDTTTQAATTTEEPASGLESAACVFGCLESFQRKGVQNDDETTSDTLDVQQGGSVCDKLDLAGMQRMCGSYLKAGVCLGGCVNTASKRIITSGLDYICKHRLEDYKKYMPCYKKTCPTMEQQCGARCGMDLAQAQEQWMNQMGVNSSTLINANEDDGTTATKESNRRRKRQNPDTESETSTATMSTAGVEEEADPLDTCQFVRCYMNCSRPMLMDECGKDAFELLQTTSNILLSFVMAPLEEAWGGDVDSASSNRTFSSMMTTCDGYFSQALTDEGIDRTVLKGSTIRSMAMPISLVSVLALFVSMLRL